MAGWFVITRSGIFGPYRTLAETDTLTIPAASVVVWAEDAASAMRTTRGQANRDHGSPWRFRSATAAECEAISVVVTGGVILVSAPGASGMITAAVPLDVIRRLLDGQPG